jgi:hypothetical protein
MQPGTMRAEASAVDAFLQAHRDGIIDSASFGHLSFKTGRPPKIHRDGRRAR